jgi:hypothetical protein
VDITRAAVVEMFLLQQVPRLVQVEQAAAVRVLEKETEIQERRTQAAVAAVPILAQMVQAVRALSL